MREKHKYRQSSPDAVLVDERRTIEVKTASGSKSSLDKALKRARLQSRTVAIHIPGADVSREEIVRHLRGSINKYRGAYDYVIVVGDDFQIVWPHE